MVQTNQAYEGIPTGGVTNKQVLGSALQTVAWGPLGLAAKGIVGTARTAGAAGLTGKALLQAGRPIATAAVEGAIGGGLSMAGSNLENDPNATTGSAIASGIGGAILGAGTGGLAAKVLPTAARKIGGEFARYGSPKEARIAADAVAELNKAMPPAGKKTVGSFLKDYTNSESSGRFSALQAMYERGKGKMIKTIDGVDKEFDPTNVEFGDLPSLYKESADSLVDDMIERLSIVSNKGVQVDTTPVINLLKKELAGAVTQEKRVVIQRYIDDFTGVTDPLAIRSGLSEIGSKVGSYLQTGANKTEGTIATKVYKELETTLNNFFAKEQVPIKELYDQF
jgi:hypothetical protein